MKIEKNNFVEGKQTVLPVVPPICQAEGREDCGPARELLKGGGNPIREPTC